MNRTRSAIPRSNRERFEIVKRITIPDEHAVEIRPPKVACEIAQSPQQVINAVLGIHGANIAKNRSAVALQRLIRLNELYAFQLGPFRTMNTRFGSTWFRSMSIAR